MSYVQSSAGQEFGRSVCFKHFSSSCWSYFSCTAISLNLAISAFISNTNFELMTLQSHAHLVSALIAAFACDRDRASESMAPMERNTAAEQAIRLANTANAILCKRPVFKI